MDDPTNSDKIYRITARLNDKEYKRFQSVKAKLRRKTGNDTFKDLIKIFDRYEDLITENANLKETIENKDNYIKELRYSYENLRKADSYFSDLLKNIDK